MSFDLPSKPVAIAEMASLFGVTHRALHFYEEKGLISANRVGLMRVYGQDDVARMAVINTCREIGVSIAAIQELMENLRETTSQQEADTLFQTILTERKRELSAEFSTIRRQIQQINTLLSRDDDMDMEDGEGNSTIPLSAMERKCLELMAEGYTPTRLARALELRNEQLQKLETGIIRKFGAQNRFQAVAKAVLLGIVPA